MSGNDSLSKQNLANSTFSVTSNDFSSSSTSNGKIQKSSSRAILGLLILCLLAIIALAVVLGIVVNKKINDASESNSQMATPTAATGITSAPQIGGENDDICVSSDCVKAASNMINSMDDSVDPCTNFFEYACGGYVRKHVIPEDKTNRGTFYDLRDDVDIKLKAVLEEPVKTDEWEAIKKAKDYYQSCTNTAMIESNNLTVVMGMVNELGGWPVISSSWNEASFNLEDVLITTRKYTNSPPIFDSYAYTDYKNPDKRIFYIDQQGFGMPNREYYLKERDDETLLAYENYATQMAIMFGADPSTARTQTKEMVDFEIQLANISMPEAERRDDIKMYNLQSLQHLIDSYQGFNWMKYFTQILHINNLNINVTVTEPIVNRNPKYLEKLIVILTNTPKKTLANYIVWRFVKRLPNVLPERIQDLYINYRKALVGTAQKEPRWKTCVSDTNSNFGLAVGNLFIKQYFGSEAKIDVENLIKKLRYAMKELIAGNEWMDEKTKTVAREKADYITPRIGYPDTVELESKVNKEYETISIDANQFFTNNKNLMFASAVKNIKQLREEVDKTKWDTAPATVNAFYDPQKNQIMFPAGILQPPFYSKDYPNYLNYGGIGYVIGHEITHGFDDSGRKYDKDGKLNQWWTDESVRNFESKADCIEQQYSSYLVEAANKTLDGKLTLGENIADNGGIKESFKAYRKLVDEKFNGKEEKRLPGMTLNPNQLFFLNAAQVWCGIMRPKEAVRRIIIDPHSDAKSRVHGPLQNFDEFSKTFNCRQGTYMNPVKKCIVW